jgi:glucosylceramidase
MKDNGQPDNYANKGTLLAADYGPFADYFVKFIQAYRDQGIPVSAITPQNEPQSPAAYPGMEFPAAAEANFVTNYLRPALDGAGLHPRIYGGDIRFRS